MIRSSNPFHIPCLALCLAFPLAALFPARAADDPAFSTQPVAANQVGYQTAWPKHFTAPLSPDGTAFTVRHAKGSEPLFQGQITGQRGDFSAFRPADGDQEYVIALKGGGLEEAVSYPFAIRADLWREQFWQTAIDFMIDCRSIVGTHPSAWGGCPWRDGTHYDFAVPSLILMHLADPARIEAMPRQLDWAADKARFQSPQFRFGTPTGEEDKEAVRRYYNELEPPKPDAPDAVKLVHWGLGWYLMKPVSHDTSGDPAGKRVHAQTVEQFAYLLWAWPRLKLERWLPQSFYDRCAAFVKEHWASTGLFEVDPQWDAKTWVPLKQRLSSKTNFPHPYKGRNAPGHSIVPNLMMYEVATAAKDAEAGKYLAAAVEQTAWIIAHVDLDDPRSTKGMRMSEARLVPSLVWFLQHHPDKAPAGLKDYIARWARIAIARSDNAWDFRRFDLDRNWAIPIANESGNLAGFPACALAASWVVEDQAQVQRLRELAVSHFDNLFGRNPRLAAAPGHAKKGFPLVERDWPKKFHNDTCARLELVRGTISASPGTEMYPFNPKGAFRHPEGWVNFNAAWNMSLAYFVWDPARRAPAEKR